MQVHDILVEAYQSGHVYHGFINALIGAGASIIGGLFGRKKKQVEETITDQTSSSTVDFAKMSSDAQAAGFNPLTAMRSGAIGGYVTTRTQGKNVTTSSGGGGAGAAIADGIGQIAGSLFGSYNAPKNDPIKLKSKSTGAVRSVVGAQLGSTGRAGSVVVAPRQTTVVSPVTRIAAPRAVAGRPPVPGVTPMLPVKEGPNRYVRVYDDVRGRDTWSVSADGPEFDQMIAAGVQTYGDYVYDAFLKSRDAYRAASKDGIVSSRPATSAEKRANEQSWHGGWLPSIGFSWK